MDIEEYVGAWLGRRPFPSNRCSLTVDYRSYTIRPTLSTTDKISVRLSIKKVGDQKVLSKPEAEADRPVSCLYTHHVDHVVEREARQDPVAAQAVGHAAGE